MNDWKEPVVSNQSESIGALAAALAKAQGEITGALKDSPNPFFKSKYADLASCWEACRAQLSKNNLAVIQTNEDAPDAVVIVTTLAHSSGEWIRGRVRVAPKDSGPQALGSCISYLRRYALCAMVGVAQVDDDAEAAQGRAKENSALKTAMQHDRPVDAVKRDKFVKRFREGLLIDLSEAAKMAGIMTIHAEVTQDEEMFRAVWDLLNAPERRQITAFVEKSRAIPKQMAPNGRLSA